MVEVDLAPLGCRVALLAFLTEGASMGLVGAMAVEALSAQLLIFRDTRMACVTVEVGVSSLECEMEAREMVEVRDLPDIISMAVRADRAHTAGVTVIRLVATVAVFGDGVFQVAATVTVSTTELSVTPQQRKAGLTSVI